MKVLGLDGEEYTISTKSGSLSSRESAGHRFARSLILSIFPFDKPCEEVFIPGCSTSLYFDFVLFRRKLAIEVQGRQHREFTPRFHKTMKKFLSQKRRDLEKREWGILNGFTIIELHDDRTGEWESIIRAA